MNPGQRQLKTCRDSPLAKSFFKSTNVEVIQRGIMSKIFDELRIEIGRQSVDEVTNIMAHVYQTYANGHAVNKPCEVRRLNSIVVDLCVENMRPNVIHFKNYLDQLDKPIDLMPRPVQTTKKGLEPLIGRL